MHVRPDLGLKGATLCPTFAAAHLWRESSSPSARRCFELRLNRAALGKCAAGWFYTYIYSIICSTWLPHFSGGGLETSQYTLAWQQDLLTKACWKSNSQGPSPCILPLFFTPRCWFHIFHYSHPCLQGLDFWIPLVFKKLSSTAYHGSFKPSSLALRSRQATWNETAGAASRRCNLWRVGGFT